MSNDSTAPVLLTAQSFSRHTSGRSTDFQERVGRPGRETHGTDALPAVVLLTRSDDPEADAISLALAARGVATVRIDSDRCRDLPIAKEEPDGALCVAGERFAPTVAWLRYFSPSSVATHDDPVLDSYTRSQWSWWARTIVDGAPRRINQGLGPCLPDRVAQLTAARDAGLAVPRTLVTSEPAAAARAFDRSTDVIVKSIGGHVLEPHPRHLVGLFTQCLPATSLAGRPIEPAPVMVQEMVPADREVRVFVVGGTTMSYEVTKSRPDAGWSDGETVTVRPTTVSEELTAALHGLARRWDLHIAGFDVLETPDGPVFLEVNAMCDWLFFERDQRPGPMTAAVTDVLVDEHHAALEQTQHPGRD